MPDAADGHLERAAALVAELEREIEPFVARVAGGEFVRAVLEGSFPLEGIRFVHTNHYHLIMNDMANLNAYVAKARDEEEMLFFHFMAAEEKNHLDSLFLLDAALGLEPDEVRASEPHAGCLVRTNYFSRLAEYGTPGEIALAILLNFPVWAGGAKREAQGLKEHYGLGNPIEGTDRYDTDILDRFEDATAGFREQAVRIIARDLAAPDTEKRLRRAGLWAAEYEAMVWEVYYAEGLKRRGGPGSAEAA
jgi:thiaminase